MLEILVESVLAYAVADLLSGVYHLMTDIGWNTKAQVELFQNHHNNPSTITRDLRPFIAGVPIALLALFNWHPLFWLVMGITLCFSQFTHYHAHYGGCWLIRLLQKLWLILPPEHHAQHHCGAFDKNYCVLTGWNNWWLNYVVKWLKFS